MSNDKEKPPKKTILILEPDAELRSTLVSELKDLIDINVIEAKDGIEANAKISNQGFSLILMEAETPKLKGTELIRLARETTENALTPILIYTEDTETPKLFTRAVKHIEYIKKPAEYQFIADKITAWTAKDLTRKEFRLDVDFINPFIDSAIETLQSMCKAEGLKNGVTYLLAKNEMLDIDISGTLNISCPYFKGTIAISFADEVYQNLVTSIMEGKQENIDIDNQDAAAEMINIVFGKTKADLNSKGYKLERAVPKVMRGTGHSIKNSNAPVLILPFESNAGKFFIQICVQAS